MNIQDIIKQALTIDQNRDWQKIGELWSLVKAQYKHINFNSIGDSTGVGWWQALDEAFSQIDALMAQHPDYTFQVRQIKEKFGTLRFYWSIYPTQGETGESAEEEGVEETPREDERLQTLRYMVGMIVDRADDVCSRTCEECGEPGELRSLSWVRTLCDVHYHQAKSRKGY